MQSPIFVQNLTLQFPPNSPIFSQLSFELAPGKWTALLGPSGVGKSSLLRAIAGLTGDNPGTLTGTIEAHDKSPITNQVAYMGQTDLLLPWLSALENTLLGCRLRGENKQQKKSQAEFLFDQMGLQDILHKFPKELSGGMRQRVALIRTLVEDKPIILMDEPFSALDAITRFKLQKLASELLKNKTVFFITHDPVEALRLAHHIYILQGSPAKIKFLDPLHSNPPRFSRSEEVVQQENILLQELSYAS